jgi:hypothetical protein
MATPVSSVERKAERMLRASGATAVPKNLPDRDTTGRFLVDALVAELEPDLGIVVPDYPISARDLLSNMGGEFVQSNGTWKSRSWLYKVLQAGSLFIGVVNAKNEAVKLVNRIVESGWTDPESDEYLFARAEVRAAQVLVDWFHWKEGKNKEVFFLGAAFVAQDLITDLCLSQADEEGVALSHIRVRESAQLSYETIMENLDGVVTLTAFGGALEYRYKLPHPGSIHKVVRGLAGIVSGDVKPDEKNEGVARWLIGLPEAEKDLYAFSAGDVLAELKGMEEPAKGNGKPKKGDVDVDAVDVTELVHGPESDDPDQQAADEALAAEYDAEIRAAKAAAEAARQAAAPPPVPTYVTEE